MGSDREEYNKKYYREHKDIILNRTKKWYQDNKSKVIKRAKNWNNSHKDKVKKIMQLSSIKHHRRVNRVKEHRFEIDDCVVCHKDISDRYGNSKYCKQCARVMKGSQDRELKRRIRARLMFNTSFPMNFTKDEFKSVIWSNPVVGDFMGAMCALMDFFEVNNNEKNNR